MDCDSYLIIPLISELGENVDYGVKYVIMDLRGRGGGFNGQIRGYMLSLVSNIGLFRESPFNQFTILLILYYICIGLIHLFSLGLTSNSSFSRRMSMFSIENPVSREATYRPFFCFATTAVNIFELCSLACVHKANSHIP